jgi:hypothetical protein
VNHASLSTNIHQFSSISAILAQSPWIPQGNWAPVVTALLTNDSPMSGADCAMQRLRLQLEVLNLCLQHGSRGGTGLTMWLSETVTPRPWQHLAPCLQAHMLVHLAAALHILPVAGKEQLLKRAQETIFGHGASAALLQCAACTGLHMAAREFAGGDGMHNPRAESSSAKRVRISVLATLFKFLQHVPVLLASCSAPSAILSPPLQDVHWRLVSALSGLARLDSCPSEAAVRCTMAACRSIGADPMPPSLPVGTVHVLHQWSSARPCVRVPADPAEQDLALWSWQALLAAYSALPAKVTSSLLDEMLISGLPKRAAESGIDQSTRDRPERAALGESTVDGPGAAVGTAWLRAAELACLRAVQLPAASETPLIRLVLDLAAAPEQLYDLSGHVAIPKDMAVAGEVSQWQRQWQAACQAAAAAVAAATGVGKHKPLLELLRTVWAQQKEEAGAAGQGGKPVVRSGWGGGWQVRMEFAAVLVWEMCSGGGAQVGVVEGLPWGCDVLGVDMGVQRVSGVGVGGRAVATRSPEYPPGWRSALNLLPWALPRLLQKQAWLEYRKEVLYLVFEIWSAAESGRSGGDNTGDTAVLAHTLECFWEDLHQHERSRLLPCLLGELGGSV